MNAPFVAPGPVHSRRGRAFFSQPTPGAEAVPPALLLGLGAFEVQLCVT